VPISRGVALERFQTVRRTGIDVEPTDSVIYVDCFEKAWEYGEWPKMVLALNPSKMKRTFVEVSADVDEDKLALLRRTFPTVCRSTDGTKLWLSRLPEHDPRVASEYERAYAWWIDGDARDALEAVFICVRPQDGGAFKAIESSVRA
jgi:hypothetical protein